MVALCAPPTRSVLEEEEEEDEGGGGGGWKKTEVGGLLLNHQEEVEAMSSPGGAASSPWRSVRHQHGLSVLVGQSREVRGLPWAALGEGRGGPEGLLQLVYRGCSSPRPRPRQAKAQQLPERSATRGRRLGEFQRVWDEFGWVGMGWDELGWTGMG